MHYAIPVGVFVYCYGRIFHTIRRQSKVISGHAGRSQNIAMTTMSRDQNAGHVQQQVAGATTGNKLSRTEMNVLKTMITVVAVFIMCWTVPASANFLQLIGVSMRVLMGNNYLHYFDVPSTRQSTFGDRAFQRLQRMNGTVCHRSPGPPSPTFTSVIWLKVNKLQPILVFHHLGETLTRLAKPGDGKFTALIE